MVKKRKAAPAAETYQLKVTLKEIRPPIWRRLQVPGDIPLSQLHEILQDGMGWSNYHLHLFEIGARSFTGLGIDEDWSDIESDDEDDSRVELREVLTRAGQKFRYKYDFGDGWDHEIVVEKILPPAAGARHAVCLAGKRACPPEDCGGPWGYQDLLKALRDPHHRRHEDLTEWVGGSFDSEAFSLDEINDRLKEIL
jgi:hypothetical protein